MSDFCHLEAKGTLGGERKIFWIFNTIPPPFYAIHATYMYCHTQRDALPSTHEKWRNSWSNLEQEGDDPIETFSVS